MWVPPWGPFFLACDWEMGNDTHVGCVACVLGKDIPSIFPTNHITYIICLIEFMHLGNKFGIRELFFDEENQGIQDFFVLFLENIF